MECEFDLYFENVRDGAPRWLSGLKLLPSAQVMIPGSWDQAPHRAVCSAGSLLHLLSLSPSLSLSLSLSACLSAYL